MSCIRGKATPSQHVKLQLFANSAGFCQNPDCNKKLFITRGGTDLHIAEMAHIFSASNNGPRNKVSLTESQRGQYENLLLLCPDCHSIIDKADDEYPDSIIKSWKIEHESRINQMFNIKICHSRKEVRKLIYPLMEENRTIFNTYGPLTDERFNPESETPKKWISHILESILPNNRQILNIISTNYHLLNTEEENVFARFKVHVKDFEAKHIGDEKSSGSMFPYEMNNLFE